MSTSKITPGSGSRTTTTITGDCPPGYTFVRVERYRPDGSLYYARVCRPVAGACEDASQTFALEDTVSFSWKYKDGRGLLRSFSTGPVRVGSWFSRPATGFSLAREALRRTGGEATTPVCITRVASAPAAAPPADMGSGWSIVGDRPSTAGGGSSALLPGGVFGRSTGGGFNLNLFGSGGGGAPPPPAGGPPAGDESFSLPGGGNALFPGADDPNLFGEGAPSADESPTDAAGEAGGEPEVSVTGLSAFWDAHGTKVFVGGALVAAGLAYWFGTRKSRKSKGEKKENRRRRNGDLDQLPTASLFRLEENAWQQYELAKERGDHNEMRRAVMFALKVGDLARGRRGRSSNRGRNLRRNAVAPIYYVRCKGPRGFEDWSESRTLSQARAKAAKAKYLTGQHCQIIEASGWRTTLVEEI